MLYDHLEMTEAEAVQRIEGHYENDISEFDKISTQALKMADYMAVGIRKQVNGR